MFEWRKGRAWRVIRVVWVCAGLSVMLYIILSFSEWGVDDAVLETDEHVSVFETDASLTFVPARNALATALLFLPGGMVDPHAYAPMLRQIAAAGHPAVLVKLPSLGGRHAMGEDGRRQAVQSALAVIERSPGTRWVLAGHSLGGHLAARVVQADAAVAAGLILIATTHPRDFSIAGYDGFVTRIYGTRDGIAPLAKMQANAANLPATTEWIAIEGGNHSQFGYYGFQLRDGRARISREAQHAAFVAAVLGVMQQAAEPAIALPSTDGGS